jgi:hypothetical protein
MYFDDGDLAATHTLACDAREIYEKHCAAQGVERMFEQIESANPHRTRKELWDILNGTRNFLKHPELSFDLSAQIEIDDEMNASMIWVACHDCAMLCEEAQPPEVQAFNLWFLSTHGSRDGRDEAETRRADEILAAIDRGYPGLRKAALPEQKRIGKKMLLDACELAASTARPAPPRI